LDRYRKTNINARKIPDKTIFLRSTNFQATRQLDKTNVK